MRLPILLEMRKRSLGPVRWWAFFVLALWAAFPSEAWAASSCETVLTPPVSGGILRRFAPAYGGGHWGVDLASAPAGLVRAPVSGTVTFAGRVAGRLSVTIAPLPRARVSLSFLSAVWVRAGQQVAVGRVLGRSGTDHGIPAVHMSLRVNGRYMNPETALACGRSTNHPWGTLRLLSYSPGG